MKRVSIISISDRMQIPATKPKGTCCKVILWASFHRHRRNNCWARPGDRKMTITISNGSWLYYHWKTNRTFPWITLSTFTFVCVWFAVLISHFWRYFLRLADIFQSFLYLILILYTEFPWFLNTNRTHTVKESALVRALRKGDIGSIEEGPAVSLCLCAAVVR